MYTRPPQKRFPKRDAGSSPASGTCLKCRRDILIIDQIFIYLYRVFSPAAAGTKMGRPLQESSLSSKS